MSTPFSQERHTRNQWLVSQIQDLCCRRRRRTPRARAEAWAAEKGWEAGGGVVAEAEDWVWEVREEPAARGEAAARAARAASEVGWAADALGKAVVMVVGVEGATGRTP
mmetsp:Transcript_4555/g.8553  ORF Transcript_4555/g.8553 Transcript_4555/m.8553 type:complete len:109 (+) Transcript_4555:1136-1462(+)